MQNQAVSAPDRLSGSGGVNRGLLGAAALMTSLFAGCDGDDGSRRSEAPRLPQFFHLSATAAAEQDGLTANCSIGFNVEIAGEVSRTNDVVEYVGTMGGDARRTLLRPDGSGVDLWADAHYPNLQVLHLLPDRVQLVSLDFPPDAPPSGSRFWDELRFFDGFIDANSVISGGWLCAPLDIEQGGIDDDTVFAEGTWETVEIATR